MLSPFQQLFTNHVALLEGTTGDPPTPTLWQPVFQSGVTVVGFGIGQPQGVQPIYCLSESSAVQLKDMLSGLGANLAPSITHMHPFGKVFAGLLSGTEDPRGVPWMAFPDGTLLNAGNDLAAWFTHGWSQQVALRMMLADIKNGMADTAALQL